MNTIYGHGFLAKNLFFYLIRIDYILIRMINIIYKINRTFYFWKIIQTSKKKVNVDWRIINNFVKCYVFFLKKKTFSTTISTIIYRTRHVEKFKTMHEYLFLYYRLKFLVYDHYHSVYLLNLVAHIPFPTYNTTINLLSLLYLLSPLNN